MSSNWSAWLKVGAFIRKTGGEFGEIIETEHLKVRCNHISTNSSVDIDLKLVKITDDNSEGIVIAVGLCQCKKLYVKIIKEGLVEDGKTKH